jgi:hypothetical protein
VGQCGIHTGIAFDTVLRIFPIPDNKQESLRATIEKLRDATTVPASFMTSVRGKILHFGCCVPHIAVAGPSFTLLLGTRTRARTGHGRSMCPPRSWTWLSGCWMFWASFAASVTCGSRCPAPYTAPS